MKVKKIGLACDHAGYILKEIIKNKLNPELLEFEPYTLEETYQILQQRVKYAFKTKVLSF